MQNVQQFSFLPDHNKIQFTISLTIEIDGSDFPEYLCLVWLICSPPKIMFQDNAWLPQITQLAQIWTVVNCLMIVDASSSVFQVKWRIFHKVIDLLTNTFKFTNFVLCAFSIFRYFVYLIMNPNWKHYSFFRNIFFIVSLDRPHQIYHIRSNKIFLKSKIIDLFFNWQIFVQWMKISASISETRQELKWNNLRSLLIFYIFIQSTYYIHNNNNSCNINIKEGTNETLIH